ncbi:GAP family protein [Nocardia mexicana]|uniref:Sap-like sulfolipid-1-addressing protein n=1 Tax=Nocardia mexicana TaxID=279262 RepID=A0A370HB23_9NOCA|nr:GAP family protein [Nocardia mexicana]RDI54122.1 Sap-like sulfolipid-1-addressing protein [Nocardia mexicana]
MVILLLALAGFAFLDSLDALLVGVTTAVIYDSRLSRRSPVPGVLSFLAGVFAVTTTFGICTVLGLNFVTDLVDFHVTPALRYWAELVVGVVLLVLGSIRPSVRETAVPAWAWRARQRPLLLGSAGVAIGLGQAPTAVPYLAGLAMLSARDPMPPLWPLIIVAYCVIALLPPGLLLFAATRRSPRAQRIYRRFVRTLRRFGPPTVRILLWVLGIALIINALRNYSDLW